MIAGMSQSSRFARFLIVGAWGAAAVFVLATLSLGFPAMAAANSAPEEASSRPVRQATAPAKPKLDHSGSKRVGKASFYAKKFSGRKMADGKKMNPQGNNAASKTLPLGTRARVTNLETGQSTEVHIQDRGPYVKGRIVDLSPSSAKKIGIDEKKGVSNVEVAPVAVPQPDGSVKSGAVANDATIDRKKGVSRDRKKNKSPAGSRSR